MARTGQSRQDNQGKQLWPTSGHLERLDSHVQLSVQDSLVDKDLAIILSAQIHQLPADQHSSVPFCTPSRSMHKHLQAWHEGAPSKATKQSRRSFKKEAHVHSQLGLEDSRCLAVTGLMLRKRVHETESDKGLERSVGRAAHPVDV